MSERFEEMTQEELKARLHELKELLDEYLDEREMVLGQSGHHVPSTGLVKKYADLVSETEESIKSLKNYLATGRV